MATKIVTKNSSTAGSAPSASDLVQGELAVNVVDKRLYTEDNAGNIVELGTNPLGEITANGGIALGDNDKATFGASDDLQIYHDGSNSLIKDTGSGGLSISGSVVNMLNTGSNEFMFQATEDGAIQLFHNGAEKLATTATGIDVTGSAVADKVTIGTSVVNYSGTDLTVGDTADAQNGVAIQTSTTGYGYLLFGDGSGADSYIGQINYKHGDDYMSFHSAGAECMRIDGGNLLVGKTATTLSVAGAYISAAGSVGVTRASDDCLTLNRTGTDGAIASFYKEGSPVGSIGTGSGLLTIGTGTGNLLFEDALVAPCSTSSLGASNGVVDLGASSRRFKDLYLSSGVYLGGTGAANKLDDYETGNWYPVLGGDTANSGTQTYVSSIRNGKYVKVGALVTLFFDVQVTALGTTTGTYGGIKGFPFGVAQSHMGGGSVNYYSNISSATVPMLTYVGTNGFGYFMKGGTTYVARTHLTDNTRVMGQISYYTND